jgi:alginate lyase
MHAMRAFQFQITTNAPSSRCFGFIFQKRRARHGPLAPKFTSTGLVFVILAYSHPIKAFEQTADPANRTRVFILDRADLQGSKQKAHNGDPSVTASLKKLQSDADRAPAGVNYSVTHKTLSPPSGSKHDYMSVAPYWWPNPNTPSGLPYIRRDGDVHPERDRTSDRKRLGNMIQTVKALGIAYFFFDNEIYADRAAELLRVWFVNAATKMNPHLKYAQSVPGRSQGRGAGIIETHDFPDMLDAVSLLSTSKAWTKTNQQQLQVWFTGYLQWLLESAQGQEEAKAKNNHGGWYDIQVASYALFTGQDQLAKKVLAEFVTKRIATQIEADGRQTHELARTQAWHYSIFNLHALFAAAAIADKVGTDMWNAETNNRSMRKAIDWLIPFATAEKKWPYKEISAFEPQKLAPLLRIAALRYREPAYEKAIMKLPNIIGDERWQLLYPKNAELK